MPQINFQVPESLMKKVKQVKKKNPCFVQSRWLLQTYEAFLNKELGINPLDEIEDTNEVL